MQYAQLDANGRVVTIVETAGVLTGPNIIQVPEDANVLGKVWNGTAFVDPPQAPLRTIPRQAFIDRWQFEELVALKGLVAQASGASPPTDALEAAVFWEQVTSRDVIHLDSALAQSARYALVAWGILTDARAAAIFA